MFLFRRANGASQVTLQSPSETTWLFLGLWVPQHPLGGKSCPLLTLTGAHAVTISVDVWIVSL